MFRKGIVGLSAIFICGAVLPAAAADLIEPVPVAAPPAPVVYEQTGGWYIRGDIGYRSMDFDRAEYILYGAPGILGEFDTAELKGGMTLGAGIGYQMNDYFRADLTGDYLFKTDFTGSTVGFCGTGLPCTSTDTSAYSAFLLLANAYVDLGTYNGFTPYVGAGIGGANVKWDDLVNVDDDGTFGHAGGKGWRFAYAAMAGVSYCLTDKAKLDVGYRYAHIEGGRMFGYSTNAGPGFEKGVDSHGVRAGLRYQFNGKSNCEKAEAAPVAYEPEPIYKN